MADLVKRSLGVLGPEVSVVGLGCNNFGRRVDLTGTLAVVDGLVRAGTVRYIGASNFSAEQIEEADAVARDRGFARFTAIQNNYSLLVRDAEREVLPTCARLGLGFVPFFPLASGLLTGKYRRGEPAPAGTRLADRDAVGTDDQFSVVEAVARFASERDLSMVEVAIGALLANETVSSVIAGATNPEQVRANVAAARWRADAGEVDELFGLVGTAAG
jgi:aryl-alcohol dehydrogenase-like predicted oxidoreductase